MSVHKIHHNTPIIYVKKWSQQVADKRLKCVLLGKNIGWVKFSPRSLWSGLKQSIQSASQRDNYFKKQQVQSMPKSRKCKAHSCQHLTCSRIKTELREEKKTTKKLPVLRNRPCAEPHKAEIKTKTQHKQSVIFEERTKVKINRKKKKRKERIKDVFLVSVCSGIIIQKRSVSWRKVLL